MRGDRHNRSINYRADLARFRSLMLLLLQDCCGGTVLGHFFPGIFQMIGAVELAKVNLPLMLSVVAIVNRSKGWYDAGAAVRKRQILTRCV